ncbi:hypothetical protein HDU91_006164 [Kappamyces sp. JEL0680]|nr:hypothetical protein HDU91_006164 [Kappamyces sp. JEL0680]
MAGPVMYVSIHRDYYSRPYSFVQFYAALVGAQGTFILGRPIRLEPAKVNRTIFISKIPRDLVEDDIREILGKYGPLEDLKMLREGIYGSFKGCLFVKYLYREDAILATLGLAQAYNWLTEWASNRERHSHPISQLDKSSIFVGKLPLHVTKQDLEQVFSQYGAIAKTVLVQRGKRKAPNWQKGL